MGAAAVPITPGALARAGASRRLLVLGGGATGAAIAGWLLAMDGSAGTNSIWRALAISELFLLAGLIAAARRPASATGGLLALFGVLYALGFGAFETLLPWRYTLGFAFSDVGTVVLAVLVLAFPHGRLQHRWDRCLAVAFALVICATKPFEVAWTAPAAACATCPPAGNLLFAGDAPFDLPAALDVREDIRSVLVALTLVTLAARFLRASRPARRVMAPLVVTTWLLAAKELVDRTYLADHVFFSDGFHEWFDIPNFLLFAAIPVAYLGGLAQTRVTRSTVGRLVADLARGPEAGPLRDLLARALGDPTLVVGFWADGRYVDAEGRPVALPGPGERAHASPVTGERGPLAVLVHDPALLEDPGLVDAVGGAARLALENERLRAQVRSQLGQVSESRARIVAAADAERRRIERDLHDGAQQRLVSLSMALRLMRAHGDEPEQLERLLGNADDLAREALEELRDLARGIHPAVLTDEGLRAALESLADRSPVPVVLGAMPGRRLAPAVEAAAYFTCSEAVTNAVKHAGAAVIQLDAGLDGDVLRVRVRDDGRGGATPDGSGLRGLADRIEALGGRLVVDSPAGAGTCLTADIPVSER